MSGALTFGELVQLEGSLAELGKGAVDVDDVVRRASTWFASLTDDARSRLGEDAYAAVTMGARTSSDPRVRAVCIGCLLRVRGEAPTAPERARHVLRFVSRRLGAAAAIARGFGGVRLSPDAESDARELFEFARGDRSFGDDELRTAVDAFHKNHAQDAGLHGRIACDLRLLVSVLDGARSSCRDRETARAALTYFVLSADAIPDDLGLVGLLDDAFVLRTALAEIRPERGEMASLLDEVVAAWPFLADLAFENRRRVYTASEFLVINAALLLEDVRATTTTSAAVVLSDSGPLPLLCGFIRALAEARRSTTGEVRASFSPGERLRNRASRADVEFDCYCRIGVDGSTTQCRPEEATHFRYRTGRKTFRVQPVREITAFVQSPRTTGVLRDGNRGYESAAMEVGPLERILGRVAPVVLPERRRRIVVVTNRANARRFCTETLVGGAPICNVLPISAARFLGGSLTEEPWTATGIGGQAVLTIVESVSDALELIGEEEAPIAAVVARVRPDTPDAANLAELQTRGVPVLAFLGALDRDSHVVFDRAGTPFWNWGEQELSALHWLPHTPGHPVSDYEQRTLRGCATSPPVEVVPFVELDDAWAGIKALERDGEDVESDGGLLADFVEASFAVFHEVLTLVVPPTSEWKDASARSARRLSELVDQGETWWGDDDLAKARATAVALASATRRVGMSNPKWEAVRRWQSRNPEGAVFCAKKSISLQEARGPEGIRWTSAVESDATSVLLPYWRGRRASDRLLCPPVAPDLTLLLYGPEREWYAAWSRRRDVALGGVAAFSRKGSPFRHVRPSLPIDSIPDDRAGYFSGDADDLLVRVRRERYIREAQQDPNGLVEARIVHFGGGAWAAFSRTRTVQTLTGMAEGGDDGTQQIVECRAWSLSPGDVVVLVRGSDRDAIRTRVDELAPDGLRLTAGIWQRALRRYAHGRALDDVVRALAANGCRRRASTIEHWLEDDAIRPRHRRRDIDAILRTTGDPDLLSELEACVAASDELFALHVQAGVDLIREVREKARSWIAAGSAPEEVVEIDARISIASVEAVDPRMVMVPRTLAGRLQEAGKWPA